jgi:hypothetical protein
MNTSEMKIDLIRRIVGTNNLGIIEELRNLMDFELNKEPYHLTPEQEHRIIEAQTEYLTRNILSEQQAEEEITQWLNGK